MYILILSELISQKPETEWYEIWASRASNNHWSRRDREQLSQRSCSHWL